MRLNRRLAPDVYLGVVSLTVDENSRFAIAGVGEVVDWLVEMRRLPDELMLDQAILRHTIEHDGSGRLDAVADLLIGFYKASPPIDISPSAYVEQFAREHAINEAVLCDPSFKLDGAQVSDVVARVRLESRMGRAQGPSQSMAVSSKATAICGLSMSVSPIPRSLSTALNSVVRSAWSTLSTS